MVVNGGKTGNTALLSTVDHLLLCAVRNRLFLRGGKHIRCRQDVLLVLPVRHRHGCAVTRGSHVHAISSLRHPRVRCPNTGCLNAIHAGSQAFCNGRGGLRYSCSSGCARAAKMRHLMLWLDRCLKLYADRAYRPGSCARVPTLARQTR
jgi:hypothetical protein